MLRLVLRFVSLLVFFAVVRMVIGWITKSFSTAQSHSAKTPDGDQLRSSRELRKDPVCGTYVPVGTAVTRTVGGQVFHFCSAACRDQYHAEAV